MSKTFVSNNIRRLRFENGEIIQKQLAEIVGVSRQTIVAIENEKYAPSLELAFVIAQAFNTPIEHVFSYCGKNSNSNRNDFLITSIEF